MPCLPPESVAEYVHIFTYTYVNREGGSLPNPSLEREIMLLHSRVCYGVADPKRVLMLYALEKGRLCVNELAAEVGLSQPAVSRHLRVLRERGLVRTVRKGPAIYYSLGDHRLIEALDLLRAVLAGQLAAERDLGRPARTARPTRRRT
jgi:DNA-binding transcriptional ArsR family regulator